MRPMLSGGTALERAHSRDQGLFPLHLRGLTVSLVPSMTDIGEQLQRIGDGLDIRAQEKRGVNLPQAAHRKEYPGPCVAKPTDARAPSATFEKHGLDLA